MLSACVCGGPFAVHRELLMRGKQVITLTRPLRKSIEFWKLVGPTM